MPRMYKLEDQLSQITANRKVLERVLPHKFFEVKWIQENLKWTGYLTKTVSSCFAAQEGKENDTQSIMKALDWGIGTFEVWSTTLIVSTTAIP